MTNDTNTKDRIYESLMEIMDSFYFLKMDALYFSEYIKDTPKADIPYCVIRFNWEYMSYRINSVSRFMDDSIVLGILEHIDSVYSYSESNLADKFVKILLDLEVIRDNIHKIPLNDESNYNVYIINVYLRDLKDIAAICDDIIMFIRYTVRPILLGSSLPSKRLSTMRIFLIRLSILTIIGLSIISISHLIGSLLK